MTLPSLLSELDSLTDARAVPTPPAAALRILEIRADPNSGVRELAKAVETDPALATKILATANSAYYRRGNEIITVEQAISMIGGSSVITIALAFSVASSVPTEGVIGGVSMTAYWSNSVLTAAAARSLANEVAPGASDESFLVGLVSGIGRVVLGIAAADRYQPLAEAHDGWPSLAAERDALGVSSVEVSAALLRKWAMPDSLSDAVAAIADPANAASDHARLVAGITTLGADVAAFYVDKGGAGQLQAMTQQAKTLGISGQGLDGVLDGIQRQATDLATQLNVNISTDEYAATISQARAELVEQALLTQEQYYHDKERWTRANEDLTVEARQDPLTELPNRRAFDEQLERNIAIRLEAEHPLHKPMGLVMIDVDHFKAVNDQYGHDIGDEVLKQLAVAISTITRGDETVARLGGEEFALFAPLATPDELTLAAERLRRAVADVEIAVPDGTLRVTASFGVACISEPTSPDDGRHLLKAADDALYQAKRDGRNRVVLSDAELG